MRLLSEHVSECVAQVRRVVPCPINHGRKIIALDTPKNLTERQVELLREFDEIHKKEASSLGKKVKDAASKVKKAMGL